MRGDFQRYGGRRMRRRGLLTVAGAGAFVAACGGSKSEETAQPLQQATRETGVISGQTGSQETPKPGGTIAIRWVITPALDPVPNASYQTQQLASFTYSRLLKFKSDADPNTVQNFEVTPDAAASQPEILDGGLRYIFKLRPDLKYHDKAQFAGRVMTAEDVKVSYERFTTSTKNANRTVFPSAGVTAVEAPDAQTVVFKLSKPFAPFLNTVANPNYLWLMPKESEQSFDPEKDMIGTGPFVYDGLQPDIEVRMKKHPAYYLKDRPFVDAVRLPIIAEAFQEVAQFQAGTLDVGYIPYENIKDVRQTNPKAVIIKYPSRTLPYVWTQQRGQTPFRDERVRQAISLLVDRDALIKLTYQGEGWWQNVIPVSLGKWYTDPKDPATRPSTRWFGTGNRDKDMAEAVALLKSAGYDEQKKLAVKFYYTPNGYSETYNTWAQTIAAFLKESKVIDPQIVTADYRSEWIVSNGITFGKVPENGIALSLQTAYTDPHDYVYQYLNSKSTRNSTGVADPDLDALMDKEVATIDENERVKVVKSITAYVNERAYYAPVMIGPAFVALQPHVRGYFHTVTYNWGAESYFNMWLAK